MHNPFSLFRYLSWRGREKDGDDPSWSGPKSLDVIRCLVLTFLKDGLEKSANPFTLPLLFFPSTTTNIAFPHLPNYHPGPSLSPPLPPDLISLKAILSVPEM